MQFSTFITIAGVALSAALGVAADQQQHLTTIWVPTATVVATNTYTATRIEQVWTTVPPYEWETTYPVVFTQTQTKTQYQPIVTSVPGLERRHARDFEVA